MPNGIYTAIAKILVFLPDDICNCPNEPRGSYCCRGKQRGCNFTGQKVGGSNSDMKRYLSISHHSYVGLFKSIARRCRQRDYPNRLSSFCNFTPAGTYGSRFRARMLHRGLSFAVQYVQLDADDLRASYTQENEPGPLPNPCSHMQGKDGAAINIRRLLLLPDRTGQCCKLRLTAVQARCSPVTAGADTS